MNEDQRDQIVILKSLAIYNKKTIQKLPIKFKILPSTT